MVLFYKEINTFSHQWTALSSSEVTVKTFILFISKFKKAFDIFCAVNHVVSVCHLRLSLIVSWNLTTSAIFPVWLISQSCLFLLLPSLFHIFSLYLLYSSVYLPNWLLFVQQNSSWEPLCVCLCPLASSECFNDLIPGQCVWVLGDVQSMVK